VRQGSLRLRVLDSSGRVRAGAGATPVRPDC
jgi:hypothetical protein